MNRKTFLKSSLTGAIGLTVAPIAIHGAGAQNKNPIRKELIKDFVVAGHGNLDKLKQMLNDYPELLHCRYDWGGGDFEEAIEGAGHVGDKIITNFLIEQGARVNIFTLSLLGKTELVKPLIEQFPQLVFARGPHNFSLLQYAKVGGEESKILYDFLLEKGLTERKFS